MKGKSTLSSEYKACPIREKTSKDKVSKGLQNPGNLEQLAFKLQISVQQISNSTTVLGLKIGKKDF